MYVCLYQLIGNEHIINPVPTFYLSAGYYQNQSSINQIHPINQSQTRYMGTFNNGALCYE